MGRPPQCDTCCPLTTSTTTTTLFPPTTPPPPPPPPPPCVGGQFHCRYDYIVGTSADEPPGTRKWRLIGFPFNSNCECDCPATFQIRNDWNSANDGEPQIGQCADAYVPCCRPNPPSSCFDYTVIFNPECGTTTTTTEGPTTTTTANPLGACCTYFALSRKFISCEENVLFSDCCISGGPNSNGFCLDSDGIGPDTKMRKHHPGLTCAQANCDDDQPFFVTVCFEPRPCPDCPEKIQQTRRCVDFPNKDQADAYARDLQNMGLSPIKGPGTCDDATGFTCKSCDDPGPCNTTTTTANPCSCEDVGKEYTQGGLSGGNCQWRYDGNSWALIYQDPVCSSCDDVNPECFTGPNPPIGTNVSTGCCSDPTTTTTQGPTTTSTQGPTTTSTQGPTTTTTTTTPGPPLGCCRDCASDCDGNGIFYSDVTEAFCDGIGGTFSGDCFISSFLAPCCATSDCPGPCITTGPPDPGQP